MYDPINKPMYDGIPKNVSVGPQLRVFINDELKPRLKDDEVFIMRVCCDGSGGMSIVKEWDAYGYSNPFTDEEYAFYVASEYKEII
jgi:hypothetical protein